MKQSTILKPSYKVFRLIVRIMAISLVMGCHNPISLNFASNISKVVVSGSEFTLAWDAAALGQGTFRVYARPHGGKQWNSMAKGLTSSSLVVTSGLLSYGNYEFAVSSVSSDGTESDLSTSLDASAIPNTGWYLEWTP